MNTYMFILSLLSLLSLFAGLFTAVTAIPVGDLVVETRVTPVYHLTSVAPKPQQFTNATLPGVAVPPPASSPSGQEVKVNPVPQGPPTPADAGAEVSPSPAPAPAPTTVVYVAEYHPPSGPAPPGAPPASSAGDTSSPSASFAGASDSSASSPSTKCRPDEPSIRVNNTSPHSICYMVEMSVSIGPSAPPSSITRDVACGPGSGFTVPSRGNIEFCPGAGFIGAVTAFRAGGKRGSRVEFNFADSLNQTFYDVDYEMGMDSCTVGPRSGRPRMLDGGARQLASLAGEKDCLGRVNEAFQRLDEAGKVALLQADVEGQWLRVDGEGNVGEVGMDKSAPGGWVRFLQMEVGLRGYVSSGSVAGEGVAGEEASVRKVADGFTWSVEERQMELTAY